MKTVLAFVLGFAAGKLVWYLVQIKKRASERREHLRAIDYRENHER